MKANLTNKIDLFNKNVSFAQAMLLSWFLLGLLLSSGCAKFTPTTKVDLTPFADQAVALGSDTDYSFRQQEGQHLKEYIDLEGTELKRFWDFKTRANHIDQAIINYSFKIAALAESEKSGDERVKAFADYLEQLGASEFFQAVFTPARLSEVLDNIRQQETLLDALRFAQPLINDLADYSMELLEEGEQAGAELMESVEANIEADYAYVLSFKELIKERKRFAMQAMELLLEARSDQLNALKQALERNELNLQDFLPFSNLTLDERLQIEKLLLNRLRIMETVQAQIVPEMKEYRETHQELDRLYTNFLTRINKSRIRLLIWTRAHQKIASGVTDPAEWFDLTDISGELFNLTGKVIDKVF